MTDQSSDEVTDAEPIKALEESPIVTMMSAMGQRDRSVFKAGFRAGFEVDAVEAVYVAYRTAYDATIASWSGDPAWAHHRADEAGFNAALEVAATDHFGSDDDPL